ncbi:MAG TPA: ECF-type sigma factor [Phycisphaerae bacterium]|nr:ECF-type sigma factor [Phycisphaerae bacterium]
MPNASGHQVTTILQRVNAGDAGAADDLLPLVYEELRLAAGRLFRSQSRSHTLQPTALVHEAYLRMVKAEVGSPQSLKSRAHFCRVAAKAMRQILINHARDKRAAKRGGEFDRERMTLCDAESPGDAHEADVLSVHESLERLALLDERQAAICELRFFGGLTVDEIAEGLGVSKRTVELDWKMAKSWLATQLA